MEKLQSSLIGLDLKLWNLKARLIEKLKNTDGIETGEVVVVLAIFALAAMAVGKIFGDALKEKAGEIAEGIMGATWNP